MSDHPITSNDFTAIPAPGVPCKLQVHDAPIYITFTPAGTATRGHRYEPGDVIPIGTSDAPRVRKAIADAALVVIEVFG